LKIDGQESILLSEADIMINQSRIELRQVDNHLFSFDIFPIPKVKLWNEENMLQPIPNGLFKRFQLRAKEIKISVEMDVTDEKTVNVKLPDSIPAQLEDIILDFDYWGSSVSASINDTIATDHLFHGPSWKIGIKRYVKPGNNEMQFEIQEWNNNISGISDEVVIEITENGAKLKEIKAIPQYRAVVDFVEN